jgi:peptide methionine sulfoxide reductase MsrA
MKNMRQALLVAGCLLATTTLFAQTEKGVWSLRGG